MQSPPRSTHAKLSASSAYRWMACPGSVKLSRGRSLPNSMGAAGTTAHWLAERKLSQGIDPDTHRGKTVPVDGWDVEITAEMVADVKLAIRLAEQLWEHDVAAQVRFEQNLTPALRQLHPDLGGTADVIVYHPGSATLRVVDFKFGAGYIFEEGNAQLLTYALGAWKRYPEAKHFVLTIIQPKWQQSGRAYRSHTVTAEELRAFRVKLLVAAKAVQRREPPRVTGPHCRWCPGRFVCPEVRRLYELIEQAEDLTQSQELEILRCGAVGVLESDRTWAVKVLLQNGQPVPGWILRQSTRDRYPVWRYPNIELQRFEALDAAEVAQGEEPQWLDVVYTRRLRSAAEVQNLYPDLWAEVKDLAEEQAPTGIKVWPAETPVTMAGSDFEPLD